ncbi:5-formyltetrahydrofolate cyclo-ligase [Chitinophaga skermanii]|uniref:5-formyltetrahydrofolate cyclo-ligase n=1 Tax=Chitinophaga skermanii TaxID=331697 RepID=A0A327QT21_9BACT|nr:5-formyltetrahydrofolate cyclo-ligase [Chitinophaga skermanii]RAJ06842.1 5-formyltetrahydrofolate cyclo-ligase [Chitinophaga skermanii]
MTLTKKDIRKTYIEQRKSLTDDEWAMLNMELLVQCSNFDWSNIEFLHIFLPILAKKEVDTFLVAIWIREHYPHIKLVTSQSNFETNEMRHILWHDECPLEENAYGIPEPTAGEEVNPLSLDMVLVPMVAFDLQGHRVGYGKGMYDKFLAQCKPGAKKVGLALFPPVSNHISDIHDGDMALDAVITPAEIYYFKPTT